MSRSRELMTRLMSGDIEKHKGQWHPARLSTGSRTALISCPQCGGTISLGHHQIGAGGFVSPMVCCPHSCGFHDHVQLVGWDAGA